MSDIESSSGNDVPKKWYTANLEHTLIDEFGDFNMKEFTFPAFCPILSSLNFQDAPDEHLVILNVKASMRTYANRIGDLIKDAYHIAVPNIVLSDISKEFVKRHPETTENFGRMLKERKKFNIEDIDKPNKGKQEKRFKHIGDCLYKCLELWKAANKSALNRNESISPEDLIRQGKAHDSLVQALKDRREKQRSELNNRTSGKTTPQERYSVLEAENASLKNRNATLLEEIDSLKQANSTLVHQNLSLEHQNQSLELRTEVLEEEKRKIQLEYDSIKQELDDMKVQIGDEVDSEQHRLKLMDKSKKLQDNVVENNFGLKRKGDFNEQNGSGRKTRQTSKAISSTSTSK